MALIEHYDLTSIHPAAWVGSTDPSLDVNNHVSAKKCWIDTTGGAGAYVLKIRNAGNTDWDIVGIAAAGSFGQQLAIKRLEELTTIAASATTDTAIQFPAGCTRLGASVRVTVGITCTTSFNVGDSGSATRFATGVSKAATSTAKGNVAPYVDASALAVRITPDTTPSDNTGRVRVTLYYLESVPPTS